MNKIKTLLVLCLAINTAFSQTFNNDTIITSTGYKVYEGLKIKIGAGSMNDGDFKYIRVNQNSMFNYYSTTGYQGLANQANSFPRSQSGLQYEVKKVMERGNKNRGFVYYAKIMMGIKGFEIDVENAINSGELEVPEEFKKKKETNVVIKETISKADELKKFKELMDAGIITKEEFEAKKQKILND
jgi:hypothetical protein